MPRHNMFVSHASCECLCKLSNNRYHNLMDFFQGWRRELVIRNPVDGELKSKNADAYYYAPAEYGSVKLVSRHVS